MHASKPHNATRRQTPLGEDEFQSLRSSLPSESVLQRSSETFRLLGTPTRLRILLALSQGELGVCDLSRVIGLSVSATSHHLQLLRNAQAVCARIEGKHAFYSVRDPFFLDVTRAAVGHSNEEVSP